MTTVEQEPQPTHPFPEFHGTVEEVAAWHALLHQLPEAVEALSGGEKFEYMSPLPVIIGYIPQNERQYFDTVPDAVKTHTSYGMRSTRAIELTTNKPRTQQLAGVIGILDRDISDIGANGVEGDWLDIEVTKVGPGQSPRNPAIHWDVGLSAAHFGRFSYTATNRLGTKFYDGPVTLIPDADPRWGGQYAQDFGAIDLESLDKNREFISAPPYAILRMPSLSVHCSPKATEETTRTFMRAFAR